MPRTTSADAPAELRLRAGEWVEVRSRAEILATLDADGCLDGLPFMPEMLQYCGRRFRVHKRAHKTCDTIWKTGARRMDRAAHLEGVRCDGTAHGGCQAECLIFWKDAWLKRVDGPHEAATAMARPNVDANGSEARLYAATRREAGAAGACAEAFRCQTTELFEATSRLHWWDVRQYIEDLLSRNVTLADFARGALVSLSNAVIRAIRRVTFAAGHAAVRWRPGARAAGTRPPGERAEPAPSAPDESVVGRIRGTLERLLVEHPHVRGTLDRTPSTSLDLEPGEYVRVRSRDEIMRTLDTNNRNRGLLFDVEMLPYCGGTYRVLKRVDRILDERTGRMNRIPGTCLVLDGVVCGGCLSRSRRFCPRSIYPYWHEIWLERVEQPEAHIAGVTSPPARGAGFGDR